MMKMKVLVAGAGVVLGCVIAGVIWNRPESQEAAVMRPPQTVQAPVPQAASPREEPAPPRETLPAEAEPLRPPVERKPASPQTPVQAQQQQAGQTRRQLQDPDARVALACVGADPEAEAYWMDAIFDTSLPDKERDDLMEDLNEAGFADPKNPTLEDLALILNRLELIEGIAPYADDFMTRHLAEAYKDLMNMAGRVQGN